MKLFYVPRTRASRPRWALEELQVPYELVRLDPAKGDTRGEQHLTRHPMGHVPVLETPGGLVFESAAIVMHLADLYPEKKLAPPVGTHERALVYQWLFYAMTELEPPAIALSSHVKMKSLDSAEAQALKTTVLKPVMPFEKLLGTQPYLLSSGFSVADIIVGAVVIWINAMGAIHDAPHVGEWIRRLKDRPAWRRSTAD